MKKRQRSPSNVKAYNDLNYPKNNARNNPIYHPLTNPRSNRTHNPKNNPRRQEKHKSYDNKNDLNSKLNNSLLTPRQNELYYDNLNNPLLNITKNYSTNIDNATKKVINTQKNFTPRNMNGVKCNF